MVVDRSKGVVLALALALALALESFITVAKKLVTQCDGEEFSNVSDFVAPDSIDEFDVIQNGSVCQIYLELNDKFDQFSNIETGKWTKV